MNDKLKRLWDCKTKDDEYWSSFFTSPLAVAVNYLVIDIPWLSPNRITLLSFVTALVSAGFIVAGGTFNFIIAVLLINISHVLDCMDGQMARYRQSTSLNGSYYDRLTDQIQIIVWFAAIGYAAHMQSGSLVPLFLTFIGVSFYGLRGYVKYIVLHTKMQRDNTYLDELAAKINADQPPISAGLGFGFRANLNWFLLQQKKILEFTEGVFILMLSVALLFDVLTPMLWLFAISQVTRCLIRSAQQAKHLSLEGVHIINK